MNERPHDTEEFTFFKYTYTGIHKQTHIEVGTHAQAESDVSRIEPNAEGLPKRLGAIASFGNVYYGW